MKVVNWLAINAVSAVFYYHLFMLLNIIYGR